MIIKHGKLAQKKTGVKLELLTDTDVLLMVEKGIRGGICHAVLRYAKADDTWKIMIKIQHHHTSCI